MLLDFRKGGFPSYAKVDEQGMPQPCALGVPWVNPDTQQTLARLRVPRTDPWGRPLPEREDDGSAQRRRRRGPPGAGAGASTGACPRHRLRTPKK
jgi:hypothetical protein